MCPAVQPYNPSAPWSLSPAAVQHHMPCMHHTSSRYEFRVYVEQARVGNCRSSGDMNQEVPGEFWFCSGWVQMKLTVMLKWQFCKRSLVSHKIAVCVSFYSLWWFWDWSLNLFTNHSFYPLSSVNHRRMLSRGFFFIWIPLFIIPHWNFIPVNVWKLLSVLSCYCNACGPTKRKQQPRNECLMGRFSVNWRVSDW